jgi:hypothetical protein
VVALLIDDDLRHPQQGLHEVPQELCQIFLTLILSLKNLAGTKVQFLKNPEPKFSTKGNKIW